MKPLKVEFQAFGPYKTTEFVDFEKLSSKGLFLITGDTGTGKTTILDAITFSLYGKSSGGGRNDFEQMRCKYADEKMPTYVRFEFENNGQYYIFERRIEKKRVNYQKSYNVMQKDKDGNWQVLFENTKESDINKKAVEIIGLEYNQFVQVIVLPQGKFEEFLVSSSDDKAKILTSIFGEDKWQAIAKSIYEKANKRVEELKDIKKALQLKLNEEGCDSLEELRELIELKKNEASNLKTEFEKKDYSKIIKENQEVLSLVKRFEDLDLEEGRREKLDASREERNKWEVQEKNARRASKLRNYIESVTSNRKALQDRINISERNAELVFASKKKVEETEENYVNHIAGEADNEQKKKLIAIYEGKRKDYEGITSVYEELNKARNNEEASKNEEKEARDVCKACDERIISIKKEYERLKQEHSVLVDLRFAGMVSELARDLEDGKPCPVCGSTSHKVSFAEVEKSVSKEEVDIKQKEVDIKYKELDEAGENKENAEKSLREKHELVETAHAKSVELSATYENMKTNMLEGIETLNELLDTIEKLSKEAEVFSVRRTELESELREAKDKYTENYTKASESAREVERAKASLSDSERILETKIKENGFSSEEEIVQYMIEEDEIDKLSKKCAEYDAEVKNNNEMLCKLKAELEGILRPDREQCEMAIEEATNAREEYAKISGVILNTIERLIKKEIQLSEEADGMEKKISDAEADLLVAKKVCGNTGIGLQRYVLGIMFSSVVSEANKMLELFNGGRYRLFRTDEKKEGSNKSGLELKVYDKYSDDENGRFVHSLSGGEKFLTSLALSIGMSSVARRGGIKIDAMFIDEGFGTLDNSCVEDAMNILDSVKKANGVVGIISHMEILRGRIPTKLIAIDEGKGSHLVQTIG